MSDDDSDADDDTALVQDTVGAAPAIEGFRMVPFEELPPMETDEEALALVGKNVLHAWDTEDINGWFRGKISSRGCSTRDLAKTPTANYVVTYSKTVTKNKHLHGRVASSLIPSKYGRSEWWVLLEPSA